MKAENKDLYSQVTERIVGDLEKGVRPWHQPWNGGNPGIPTRHNGLAYRGINIILLWVEALQRSYASSIWMTYKQAQFEGGQVRGGERGSMVVFRSPFEIVEKNAKGEEAPKTIQILKRYTVFNVEQIDGLPEKFRPPLSAVSSPNKRIDTAEAFIKATAAVVQHGGGGAYYSPPNDLIQMPPFERFEEAESYYATLLHELTHWTRHQNRLNRDFGQQKCGDTGYATEELVAEIGAAFLCAELGITPEIREDHAAYIGHWLSILKEDNRAIFRAAAHAQRAADYIKGLQPRQPAPGSVDQTDPGNKPDPKEKQQPAPTPAKKPRRKKGQAAKFPTPVPQ